MLSLHVLPFGIDIDFTFAERLELEMCDQSQLVKADKLP